MDKLKPYPFCGSKFTQVRYMGVKWLEPSAFSSGFRGECCDCYAVTAAYDTEAEAVAAWNARAERTCTVEKFQQNVSYGDYYCELSCGHWFDVVDDMPPAYCLICGAKVVR